MDEMQDYEIQTLSGMTDYVDYNQWRRMRILYHGIVSPYLKQKKTPQELFPLAGDDNHDVEHDIEITDRQVNTMRRRADAVGNMLKNNKRQTNGKHG